MKESVMYPGAYLGAAVGLAQFVFLRKAPIAMMRRAGQTNFQESAKMKPFSLLFDAVLSTAMAGTVWIMATDKDKVFKTASELPLVEGRSDVSDALCDDFIAQYETIRPEILARLQRRKWTAGNIGLCGQLQETTGIRTTY